MPRELAFLLGLTNANSWPYLAWSGVFGDLAKITVPCALLFGIWRQARKHHVLLEAHNQLLKAHHELLEDHHLMLLRHAIDREVSV